MKLHLNSSYVFVIAQQIATDIHSAVVTMHLRTSWGAWPGESGRECPYKNDFVDIREIRKTIRSIKNAHERDTFVRTIRFLFHKIRAERGTRPKWQEARAAAFAAAAAARKEAA